ncbi:hypothetical protein [Endozoicomonas atrinae]|uniref:hypothetical protein n=1 Tax=Endozoicomonas atrinae TaxID=1333660 RepID=UPI003B00460E
MLFPTVLMKGMYYGGKIALQMLVYIDSSNATESVPLFSSLSNTSTPPDRFYFEVSVVTGKIRVQLFDRTTQKSDIYFSELISFDQMIEIKIIHGNPYPYIHAWVNGTKLTLESGSASTNNSIVFGYFQATIGGVRESIPQSKGVLFSYIKIINDNNFPSDTYASNYVTEWVIDFEDEADPFKVKTKRNNVLGELNGSVTYQPEKIVWTSGNTPPADTGGGGGSGGGIVVPGNGNTTQVQGSITENDLPVARRVFAITEAELTIDGSQETTQAVLANAISSEIDGSYTLDTSPYEGTVFVIATDDYGTVWQPDTAYVVGDVIRPPTFQGYVYLCTLAGTTSSTEPIWWFETDSSQSIGTAQFQAKPFSRPLAHGPIIPTIIPSV